MVAFFNQAGLGGEIEELGELERRLRQRSERDLVHAAFSARVMLHAVADALFPARLERWTDSEGNTHKVGTDEFSNRLSAYVDERLGSNLEACQRRAFQGEIDALRRWSGRGPHGVHDPAEADQSYARLLSVLCVVARAYGVAVTDFVA